jgi:DNA-binding NtrC family response regulator
LKNILEEVEKEVILEYLQENNGNKNKTAKMLGISRVNLYKKLEKYDLKDV